ILRRRVPGPFAGATTCLQRCESLPHSSVARHAARSLLALPSASCDQNSHQRTRSDIPHHQSFASKDSAESPSHLLFDSNLPLTSAHALASTPQTSPAPQCHPPTPTASLARLLLHPHSYKTNPPNPAALFSCPRPA